MACFSIRWNYLIQKEIINRREAPILKSSIIDAAKLYCELWNLTVKKLEKIIDCGHFYGYDASENIEQRHCEEKLFELSNIKNIIYIINNFFCSELLKKLQAHEPIPSHNHKYFFEYCHEIIEKLELSNLNYWRSGDIEKTKNFYKNYFCKNQETTPFDNNNFDRQLLVIKVEHGYATYELK